MVTTEQSDKTSTQTEDDIREKQGIIDWVKNNIGGSVTRIERQRRWRPVWRVDVDKNGNNISLLFKGMRAWDAIPYPLEHEMKIFQILEANDIPVPHSYGLCESPKAIVVEQVRGGRDPGLVEEAMENESVMSEDRWAASLKYMDILARIHKIDPVQFEAAGLSMPMSPEDIELNGFERFYSMLVGYNATDPLIEFCWIWLQRNVPKHRSRVSFVTGDCGQFLSDGPEVTAVLDLEIGYLGDHLQDIACFRGRHPVENMGDLPSLFKRYSESFGEELDLPVLAYQTVLFLCIGYTTPLFAFAQDFPGGDWMEAAAQTGLIGRRAMEAIAEIIDLELDDITLPEPHVTPFEDITLRKLIREIRHLPTSDTFPDWQRNTIAAIPQFMLNQIHYGLWAEDQYLDDIQNLLGHRPANQAEADTELKKFIHQAGYEHDAALVRLLHRKLLRFCLIIAGPNPPENHIMLMKMEHILNK